MFKKLALSLTAAVLTLTALAPAVLTAKSANALGANLINNPSVETASGTTPTGWTQGNWGTNTAAFSYATTGHTGSRSLSVNMTKHTNGDAKWYFTDIAVKPSTSYTYSEYYQSNVATEIDAQYTSTSNALTYADLSNPAASASAWKQVTVAFTTPANVKTVTIWHLINKVGTLQTDDFSLAETNGTTTTPTAPTVNFTAPAANATISGTATPLTATASDAVSVAGVQFKVDNTNVGAEDTTAPYSVNLNTTTLTNGTHTLTAVARNGSNLTNTATETVTVQNATAPTAPTVNVTAPVANATVSGTTTVTATAAASTGRTIKSVQFQVDGVNTGTADKTSPYSASWNTTTVPNGQHTLTAVVTDSTNVTTTSAGVLVNVNNPITAVAISAPVANATVSGTTTTVTATATAATGKTIKNVQFKLDGVNLGTADKTSPYSVSWNTTTAANGPHTLSATVTDSSNATANSTGVLVTVNNPVTTVVISAPTANATVSGTTTALTATVTPTAGKTIKNVQFKVDGTNVGTADTTSPYSVNWNTTTVPNGQHTLTAVATDNANVTTTSAGVIVTVNNPTPPTVSITAPAASTTVSGTATAVTANASDAVGVTSVQFKLDGNNLGNPVTTAPYTTTWDTTTATNGNHTLTAVATNGANLSTTSAGVAVTVSNTTGGGTTSGNGPNLIANPSFETANGTTPQSWITDTWGTNTTAFTYLNTGHTGSHSVEVQTTKFTNGASEWYYGDLPITAGQTYQYTNWYKSNVDTEVDAEVVMNDGTVAYYYLGTVLANANWTKFTTTFTPPAGAVSMSVYQILAKVGYIITDDYSLNTYTPSPFNRAIVSVTFDDGWTNQYNNAEPVLEQLSIPGTYYIISNEMTDPDEAGYMTSAQVLSLYQHNGNEIASHTVHHCDLTGQQTDDAQTCPLNITSTQINSELQNSQTTLQNLIGTSVPDFAYPYGAYNSATIANASEYYQTQRSVNAGYNTKDNLDLTQLKIYEVDSNITQAQVQAWIDGAIASKSWLILVYHEVATTPSDPSDADYTTQPTDFTAEMNYLKSTGVATETVHQAVNEVLPQE